MDQLFAYLGQAMTYVAKLLTPAEWSGLIWLLAVVSSFTEIFKRTFRAFTAAWHNQPIYMASFVMSGIASFFLWPHVSTVPWWIVGIIGGPAANLLHRVTIGVLKWKYPELAAAITGDRRKTVQPPPGGVERRT